MSIFFEFEIGSRGWRFRRAVDADKYDIESFLCKEHTEPLFGEVDIGCLIELSTLAICLLDEKKDVTGFMALSDGPNVPAVDPAGWEEWMRNMFQKYYLARSTLFIHFMCCTPKVIDYFMEQALFSVFRNDVYLHNIVIVIPPNCPQDAILRYKTFKHRTIQKYNAMNLIDEVEQGLHIYVAKRLEFYPKLKIRRALEEDNDEIVEILDKCSPRLKEIYGEYYISEIIGRHPGSQRKILVSEAEGVVTGVMCLNGTVNYRKLQKTYEVQPYHWLIKATPLEREQYKHRNNMLNIIGYPIMDGKWRPFKSLIKEEDYKAEIYHPPDEDGPRTTQICKVNFAKAAVRRSFDHIYYRTEQHSDDLSEKLSLTDTHSVSLVWSEIELLDPDPFDYEIVNIDPSLFALPTTMSFGHELPDSMMSVHKEASDTSAGTLQSFTTRSKAKRRTSLSFGSQDDLVSVHCAGDANAFSIELFGTIEGFDDGQAFDFLEAAFEIMKDKDYCIIRVPCTGTSFSLLQHFSFVPTKPHVCCEFALYVAHRSSVLGKLRVRIADTADVPQISNLLLSLEGKESIWMVENCIFRPHEYETYVLLSGLTVVGFAIIEPTEQLDFLRSKFNMDPYHNHKYHLRGSGSRGGFTTLLSSLVYPVFEPHFRFFMRDIMRHAGTRALLWLTAYRHKWVVHKSNSITGSMVPILPRKSEIDCTVIKELKYFNAISKDLIAFSTWFMSSKLTSVPMVNVDTRIVIAGASRTAMGFLNTLLFSDASSYLTFTNVTIISPGGLSARRVKPAASNMFLRYRTSDDKYLKSTPYTYYVNVVQGTVVGINRQHKYVELFHDATYHYDLLFLLFGKPFQHPDYLKVVFDKYKQEKTSRPPPYQRLDVPRLDRTETQLLKLNFPENVFCVKNLATANRALDYAKIREGFFGKILVYGACIHSYCCLTALLQSDIAAENIVFIEPFPSENPKAMRVPIFCNSYVDQTIREILVSLKIKVYSAYYFESWTLDSGNRVTHVDFISHHQKIRLECAALFYYGRKGIGVYAFTAISKSGIPYDGGILIDPQFRTTDPSIYAAGPVTRYHRKYFGGAFRHKHYDSYEVGEKLGTQIRNQLDPLFKPTETKHAKTSCFHSTPGSSTRFRDSSSFDKSKLIAELEKAPYFIIANDRFTLHSKETEPPPQFPQFKMPIVMHCVLPGNMYYLDVRPPGKQIPHYYLRSLDHTGIVMETFKEGYFKLHLTDDLIVDGVTCLTADERNLDNFKNLYGLSAVVLNNVHLRYGAKKLDNFYSFFRSPWALYLYHEHKNELLELTKELLPKDCRSGETLFEAFRIAGDKMSHISKLAIDSKMAVQTAMYPHMEAIASFVLEWVSDNELLLPMYLKPHLRVDFEHDMRRNPLFKRRKRQIKDIIMFKSVAYNL